MREITVTARVTYTYDLDETSDFGIANKADAISDVRDILDSGQLSSFDFTIEAN